MFFIFLSIIGNIVWLMGPLMVGRAFNSVQFSEKEKILSSVIIGLLLFVDASFLGWLLTGVSRVIENKNAFLIYKNYRLDVFKKVMDLPVFWHKNHHSGDTIDKVNKASSDLFSFSSELYLVIGNIVGLMVSIIVLCFYDLKSLIFVIISAPLVFLVVVWVDRKMIKNYKEINKAENFLSAGIYDYISNYITIISLRFKEQVVREVEERSVSYLPISLKNFKLNEWKWASVGLIIAICTALILSFNAYSSYSESGVIAIGTIFILYKYLDQVGNAFYSFAGKYSQIVSQNTTINAAEVIFEEHQKLNLKKGFQLPSKWNFIEVKGLSFSYKNYEDGHKIGGVRDVFLCIKKKSRIALIGSSGSGKSTILSILRGLHEPDQGYVFCENKKMRGGIRHIHDYCVLIPQDPEIFNDTIENNITLGIYNEEKDLFAAIEAANLKDLIDRLKDGIKTNVLEKGVSLSGGEKQRLALARGFLAARHSDIVLLDEPTSSVDIENELKIYQNIFTNFKDKTIVSAIHSLHLLRSFDYIYMLKDGVVVAEGDFVTLLKNENFAVVWESYNKDHRFDII